VLPQSGMSVEFVRSLSQIVEECSVLPGFDLEFGLVLLHFFLVIVSVIEFFEKYFVVITWCFPVFSVFLSLPFVFGDVDRWRNPVIGLDLDRFDAVSEVIGLGCPRFLVLLGFDLELCKVLVSKLVRLIIRYFTDFLVSVFLPFVFGDVDRWLNPVIGLGLDRFDAVSEVIDLWCP
jgi:hypothetical protein